MTRAYQVAEHIFHLELPEESPLWERLGQYRPFEAALSDNPLFTLKLVDSLPERNPGSAPERVYDVPPEPGAPLLRLYRTDWEWLLEMAPTDKRPITGRVRTDAGFRNAELCLSSSNASDAVFSINNSAMVLFAFCSASLGTLEMHASVVSNSGKGYLFLAPSGTGKSTHSRLWINHIPGSELLNDDNPVVRVRPDGRVIVYGTPWSGKTPCYRNIECPVGAFVQIRRCSENRIEPLPLLESYALLYSSSSGLKEGEMGDGLHSTLEKIVTGGTPCYILDCRPDEEAARICSAKVMADGQS